MTAPLRKPPCPICGDPNAFPIWIDVEPPGGCPNDESWMEGRAPAIRDITQCRMQMDRARNAAERRRLAPHCFDAAGNPLPGMANEALRIWIEAQRTQGSWAKGGSDAG